MMAQREGRVTVCDRDGVEFAGQRGKERGDGDEHR